MTKRGTGLPFLFFFLFFFLFPARGLAGETAPSLAGEAAVLMDARNGQVLYAKNMHKRMYPASTTKILTALLALEKGNLDELVTVPEEACRAGGSAIGLQAGERLTLRDLLYALLLASANDAAVAIADHLAGSVENFSGLMNEKASSLGAADSHFTNPHGLPDPGHYTSAYDLALIARCAMQNPTFREMVKTRLKIISRPEADRSKGPPQEHLWNHNRLLERYQDATGIKTGYTVEAGQCLVASAQREQRELIAVVLDSQGEAVYDAARQLLDYGFNNFFPARVVKKGEKVASVKVAGGEPEKVDLLTGSDFWYDFPQGSTPDLTRRLRIAQKIQAPLRAGQKAGQLLIYDGEQKVGTVDLVTACAVERAPGRLWLFWLAGAALLVFYLRTRTVNRRKQYLRRRLSRKIGVRE